MLYDNIIVQYANATYLRDVPAHRTHYGCCEYFYMFLYVWHPIFQCLSLLTAIDNALLIGIFFVFVSGEGFMALFADVS